LIIQIRDEPVTENDVINVVAHSQGTIITMLANMLVKQAGYSPANCVILNNSPYSLESRLMENAQSGHHQTSAARQQTFKNFCAVMAEQYKGGELSGDDIEALEGAARCAGRKRIHCVKTISIAVTTTARCITIFARTTERFR
jgi:hypothetical protein